VVTVDGLRAVLSAAFVSGTAGDGNGSRSVSTTLRARTALVKVAASASMNAAA
jgi:hypothetical protein